MRQKYQIVEFDLTDLLPIGMTLVVAGIGIAYGLDVMGDIKDDQCDGTRETYDSGNCYLCSSTSPFYRTGASVCSNESTDSASSANVSASVGGDSDFNASNNAVTGIAKIPSKMPMIATVVVAAVIIGILVRYLMVRFS